MQKTFTVEEIRKYILSKDSIGDALYYLSEDRIIEANQEFDFDEDDDE